MQGQALKLNMKLDFTFGKTEPKDDEPPVTYLESTKGGLFVDFAKQLPQKVDGHARFAWTDTKTLVTAKLGLVDLSGLLVAYRAVRETGKQVPQALWPLMRDNDTEEQLARKRRTAAFTHKPALAGSPNKATTIIQYTFEADGGVFRISKSKDAVGSINLTLSEEYRVFRLFDMALDTLIRTGGR